jgi:CubicO group peptidase (beta-lactamase class C family)
VHFWRSEPDVAPDAVEMDGAVLDALADEFRTTLEKGELCGGSQVAVFRRGRCVLHAGGGLARDRLGTPVEPDTLFVLFSATQGLAGLAMLRLYERKAFHYDEPVCKYWPSFDRAVPEKCAVSIRHVMSHRAGFPLGPRWLDAEKWGDRAEIQRAMEEVRMRFVPGERNAYHAMNYGHMVNELMLRIDGRDCGAFLREEVFEPLGLRDLYVGLPDDPELEERVAWCTHEVVLSPSGTGVGGPAAASPAGPVGPAEDGKEAEDAPSPKPRRRAPPPRYADIPEMWHEFNWPETHRAVLPAAGGIGTARDLAELYSVLAMGGQRGDLSLASREGLDFVSTPTNRKGDRDGTIRLPIRWGLGFHVGMYGRGSTLRTFGHAGAGGQTGFADPDRGLSFAFVTTGETSPDFQIWRYRLQSMAFQACR